MSKPEEARICVKFSALVMLVMCLILLSYEENIASYMEVRGQQAAVPTITVLPQTDTPIRISVLSYNSADPRNPEVVIEVTNISNKPVSAYVISQMTLKGTEKTSGSLLSFMDSADAILQPGQYNIESVTYQPLSEITSHVTLSIDFVEFKDGNTWGANTLKFAEQLNGRRAGVREANQHFLKIYKEKGLQAVISAIKGAYMQASPPAGYSAEWEEGFRNGFGSISKRLRRILNKDGVDKVETELRRVSSKSLRDK